MSHVFGTLINVISYYSMPPEYMANNDIVIPLVVTDVVSDDPAIAVAVSMQSGLYHNNIFDINPQLEFDACRLANELIAGDSISVVAIDVSRFPVIMIIIYQSYKDDPEDRSSFAQSVRNTVQFCAGKREQALIIVNTANTRCVLKRIKY